MAVVTARGLRFHVQTQDPPHVPDGAEGTPVGVFVHGLVIDNLSSFYYTLAGPVAAAGARVVLYDLRGHGRSERPPAGYGAGDAVADLFAVLDVLGLRRPVYLAANSFGGVIALNAALARPQRIAGLVMIEAHGPAETGAGWNEDMLNTLSKSALVLEYERLAEQMFTIGWRQRGKQALACDELINHTTLLQDLAAVEPIRPTDLTDVTCPVLAVYGRYSDLSGAGHLLAEHVPDCTLHILPGAGHTILREATCDLIEVMLCWLADQAATTPPDRLLAEGKA
jgi:pimeloyl-ACP methyl ester carboxylesterase